MADVTATPASSTAPATGAAAATSATASTAATTASADQSKVTAFQLALEAALQNPPVLADGGGTDDDNDDGTSLTVQQGTGFPMP